MPRFILSMKSFIFRKSFLQTLQMNIGLKNLARSGIG